MTQEELKLMSELQLDIMDEVHRVCVEYGITYYIIAGTLLGAVRHTGFIPWDLDIDIAMPREDYDRFKEIAGSALAIKYTYLDHENCKNYYRPHALVVRNDTRVHLKYDHLNPKMFDLGVYIDIFPLDQAPDAEKLRDAHAKKLKRIRWFKDLRIPYCYSYKAWRRFVHRTVSLLVSWIPLRAINRRQQKLMQKYRSQQTKCLCSMASQYSYRKQCMSKDIYGTPVLLEFEGRQYYAPREYVQYLTRLYGDYMQLPPVEKRQANLNAFTSIETNVFEYK